MNDQWLNWLILIVPWATLLLMRMEQIKRYLPVAMLATITSVIIVEIGLSLDWWHALQTAWPLKSMSYLFGAIPVSTLWIMKFTYGKFWWYAMAELVFNIGFAYGFLKILLGRLGIFQYAGYGPFNVLLITTIHGMLLYLYQIWQEGIYVQKAPAKPQ